MEERIPGSHGLSLSCGPLFLWPPFFSSSLLRLLLSSPTALCRLSERLTYTTVEQPTLVLKRNPLLSINIRHDEVVRSWTFWLVSSEMLVTLCGFKLWGAFHENKPAWSPWVISSAYIEYCKEHKSPSLKGKFMKKKKVVVMFWVFIKDM